MQARVEILRNQHDRTFIQSEITWRYPAIRGTGFIGKRGIESCFETVRVYLLNSEILDEIIHCREHDFRREGQGRDRRPRSDRTVIGTVRNPARDIIVKLPLTASHRERS